MASEEPTAVSKPDVVDVEMFEDPSIPYEQVPDEEMSPGYFEGEEPMEVEKEATEGPEPMNVESGDGLPSVDDVPVEPSRVPRRLEQVLHRRLDAPEGLNHAVGENEAPKLATVVNAVLINKNSAFPEQMKLCGSKVWLATNNFLLLHAHLNFMFTCVLYSYLLAPVDESALHVEAFWIEKIRMVAELPCVVVLGFLLGGIPFEGHIGSRFIWLSGSFGEILDCRSCEP